MNKNMIKTSLLVAVLSSLFVSGLGAIGIEKKTGNVFRFNFGYGYNTKTPDLSKDPSVSTFHQVIYPTSGGHGGFAFELADSYEIFFTEMHGIRFTLGGTFEYLTATPKALAGFPSYVKDSLSYKGFYGDLSATIDYRNDFYRRGNWDFGAFVGLGWGYSIYSENFGGKAIASSSVYNYHSGGMNYEGGVVFTYKNYLQLEVGVKYKDRDQIGNLNTYAGIGFKY